MAFATMLLDVVGGIVVVTLSQAQARGVARQMRGAR